MLAPYPKGRRRYVQIEVVSGFNLSTCMSDKIDPYVEIMVIDGDNHMNFKSSYIENDNMRPRWNYEIKFTINNPSLCFIVF